ncbi:MAG: hypothetical protein A3F26_01500 [Candidatus Ryanbacteria bacterium RIFCSPHIGHO2_12_FULL_47_12b]|uniref:CBS domain-containing protein n=3 Tax=Parcubacteria group TaxID=1794811 RepID=A0A1G2H5I2_9BACT|nr:MAG: CBS domain containing membrane protein [Parcubacteria group bacterium GW2011_GWA2_47_10b]KKU75994.1 MAG: CBS domain containing membrane protein [Candidatus Giovannonibacteria bacterium GW2011_GWB1_47_6b]KKU85946.1 MAG: CBS domain containing membrane protein [Parcubacteria group bacterium GW2011_GWA1_47_9]OGZ47467.1 MAG: hypothetical protein A2844_00550 [Candidatus Ryanbacteria bacterium RIFCSPHIGHO2_01_FULL_48_80]OGZ49493.1 MAG: hypothetical protein A3C83_02330 [Candidatus Ryanbacteria 
MDFLGAVLYDNGMEQALTVRDVMTRDVITVGPDMQVISAAMVLDKNNIDGVPVVSTEGILEGILTEYDLISKGSAIHLPTFISILQNLAVFRKDRGQFKKEVNELALLKVRDLMNPDPLTLSENATFEETVAAFRDHHRVNPIPVVDKSNKVVGVVSRYDVLKPFHV